MKDEAGQSLICASLNHTSLTEPPPYRALSYCWGDALVTKPIVDNATVSFSNHREFGGGIRGTLKPRKYETLWVDALCINQEDLVERGLQVMGMGIIFSKAEEVVAWLGVEADKSWSVHDMLGKRHPRSYESSPDWLGDSNSGYGYEIF